jgi:hypothetical protein
MKMPAVKLDDSNRIVATASLPTKCGKTKNSMAVAAAADRAVIAARTNCKERRWWAM